MRIPRFMIAAPASGSGKTQITCGLLLALQRRKIRTQAFKCGPDFIDPMYYRRILGVSGRNLDSFFCGPETIRYLLAREAGNFQMTVLEGVMGFFDGLSATSLDASSYDLARITQTPVLLLVNGRGMSRSVIPLIRGILGYRSDCPIVGVIFNQMSADLYPGIRALVEQECGIPVLGYMPRMPDTAIPSRRLGLVTPADAAGWGDKLGRTADQLERTVDIPGILRLACQAPDLSFDVPDLPGRLRDVRIGVAADEAFCFLYEDNLTLLRDMGAEIVPFSPLCDPALPPSLNGLILPGGYPELYAGALEENLSLRCSVLAALRAGLPALAECGGFLYLHRTLEDEKRTLCRGVGFLDAAASRTDRLKHFGYLEMTTRRSSLLGPAGTAIRGHEFHYYKSTDCGTDAHGQKPQSERGWDCLHADERLVAGFPHLYYYSNPEAAWNFLRTCAGKKGES